MTNPSSTTSPSSNSLRPSERMEDLPRIQEALNEGVRQALRRHKLAGNPVATWRDGAVVWIQPEDIPAADAPAEQDTLSVTDDGRKTLPAL